MSVPPEGPALKSDRQSVVPISIGSWTTVVPRWLLRSIATGLIVVFGGTSAAGWTGLIRTDDLPTKTEVEQMLKSVPTMEQTNAVYEPKFENLDGRIAGTVARIATAENTVKVLVQSTTAMQDSIWQADARALSREAAALAPAARKERVRDLVYERALNNLRTREPIHDGLDVYLR
jgi:hypothetical protein